MVIVLKQCENVRFGWFAVSKGLGVLLHWQAFMLLIVAVHTLMTGRSGEAEMLEMFRSFNPTTFLFQKRIETALLKKTHLSCSVIKSCMKRMRISFIVDMLVYILKDIM